MSEALKDLKEFLASHEVKNDSPLAWVGKVTFKDGLLHTSECTAFGRSELLTLEDIFKIDNAHTCLEYLRLRNPADTQSMSPTVILRILKQAFALPAWDSVKNPKTPQDAKRLFKVVQTIRKRNSEYSIGRFNVFYPYLHHNLGYPPKPEDTLESLLLSINQECVDLVIYESFLEPKAENLSEIEQLGLNKSLEEITKSYQQQLDAPPWLATTAMGGVARRKHIGDFETFPSEFKQFVLAWEIGRLNPNTTDAVLLPDLLFSAAYDNWLIFRFHYCSLPLSETLSAESLATAELFIQSGASPEEAMESVRALS